jgi:hypothetical protein
MALPIMMAAVVDCAADRPGAMSGTWSAYGKSDACPRCEFGIGLDLAESQQGLVTGVIVNWGTGEFDLNSDAYAVFGTRSADSIQLAFHIPCDTAGHPISQWFRGQLSRRADTLRGEFRGLLRYRTSTDSFRFPVAFSRGKFDSLMVSSVEWLARSCRAAA